MEIQGILAIAVGGLVVLVILISFTRMIIISSFFITTSYAGDRRTCKRCGQKQGLFGHEYCPPYWVDMEKIIDPNCRCHKYSEKEFYK